MVESERDSIKYCSSQGNLVPEEKEIEMATYFNSQDIAIKAMMDVWQTIDITRNIFLFQQFLPCRIL
jgi:hypothetical protein